MSMTRAARAAVAVHRRAITRRAPIDWNAWVEREAASIMRLAQSRRIDVNRELRQRAEAVIAQRADKDGARANYDRAYERFCKTAERASLWPGERLRRSYGAGVLGSAALR